MLDYALFRSILEELRNVYPAKLHPNDISCLKEVSTDKRDKVIAYLSEHGLINVRMDPVRRGSQAVWSRAAITMRGIDFLEPDGGLSALAAPTIRIAPESLIAIIDEALARNNVSEAERSAVQEGLRVAGKAGLESAVGKIVDVLVEHAPGFVTRLFGAL